MANELSFAFFVIRNMKQQLFRLSFVLLMLSPAFSYAQKAFEAINYTGKVQGLKLKFILADGYLGACQINATNIKTHKKTHFSPEMGSADEHKNLTFYKGNGTSKTEYFVISGMEELFETPPEKIKGIYYLKEKPYPFILKQ
jgi:hypothetical protein